MNLWNLRENFSLIENELEVACTGLNIHIYMYIFAAESHKIWQHINQNLPITIDNGDLLTWLKRTAVS